MSVRYGVALVGESMQMWRKQEEDMHMHAFLSLSLCLVGRRESVEEMKNSKEMIHGRGRTCHAGSVYVLDGDMYVCACSEKNLGWLG